MNLEVCLVLILVALASASTKPAFWKGTPLDSAVERMRSSCEEDDTVACLQYKAFWFLDSVLQGDYFQLPGNVEVSRNDYRTNEVSGRSDVSQGIEELIKSYNIKFSLPVGGSVTVDSRSLDDEKLDFKLDFSGSAGEARKKHKVKKILYPILTLVLLKAITLVPFILGALLYKAWNSLQLAFLSFIISTGLAIFQLCQKLVADSAHAHIATAPGAWDHPAVNHFAARSLDGAELAYSEYLKEQ